MDVNRSLGEAVTAFRNGDFTLVRDITGAIQREHPGEPGSLRLLGQIYYLEGDLDGAVDAMEASLKAKPEQYSLWIKLGNAYADEGEYSKSENAYTKAMGFSDDPHLAHLWRAQTRALLGDMEGAFRDLDAVKKANPSLGLTYRLMVKLGHPEIKTPGFANDLQAKLAARVLDRDDTIQVHYALAGICEADFDLEKMWFHLDRANGLQKNRAGAWVDSYRQIIERSKEIFTPDFIKTGAKPDKGPTPVFIVGLPRSGSTLLEKMLAGHPKISGAGETNLIPRVIGQIQVATLLNYPNGVETLSPDQFTELAKVYSDGLEKRAGGKPFATDKLLSNAFFAGLIVKLFPQAKILYLKRDPLDTAFSIYKNHFWEGQSPEFCSLGDIGAYARMTDEIMAHWQKVCAQSIHEVRYENLVKTPEKTLKSAIEFLGLPWHPACLEHEKSKTLANTLSTAQVDKPLSTASIGLGQEHKDHLAAFEAAYSKDKNK